MKRLLAALALVGLLSAAHAAGDVDNPPVTKTKLLSVTRDLALASGSVAYTGMGFKPATCMSTGMLLASLAQYVSVFGMVDNARSAAAVGLLGSQLFASTNFVYFGDSAGTSAQQATVASFDADGLTLSWTKVGTPSGTATFYIMCFR